MRAALILAAALSAHATSSGAQAQVPAVVTAAPQLYDRAPWWIREPVIASLGEVRTEAAPNRVTFNAAYEAVDRDAADATKAAAAKVRALGAALSGYGADKVRVTTTFSTRPLYAQYRDKDGNIQTNERPDKIDRYAVTANVNVEVRDVAAAERVYATLLAAHPTSTSPAFFRLQPSNALNSELFRLAVADAARRAKEAAAETGAHLGAVKLIDPTGRACSTDVLIAGGPRTFGSGQNDVQEVVVTGSRREAFAEPPPPQFVPEAPAPAAPLAPSPGEQLHPEDLQLPLQAPVQQLTREACVVYALNGAAQ